MNREERRGRRERATNTCCNLGMEGTSKHRRRGFAELITLTDPVMGRPALSNNLR